jgi:hypothetical protein
VCVCVCVCVYKFIIQPEDFVVKTYFSNNKLMDENNKNNNRTRCLRLLDLLVLFVRSCTSSSYFDTAKYCTVAL